jgi:hypothetical protein
MQIVSSAFPSTQILGIISFYTEDRLKNEDDKVKKQRREESGFENKVTSFRYLLALFFKRIQ